MTKKIYLEPLNSALGRSIYDYSYQRMWCFFEIKNDKVQIQSLILNVNVTDTTPVSKT